MRVVDNLSIVIPVYNSERTLPVLVSQLVQILPTLSSFYEVILVNDGSRDCSWEVICALAEEYDWLHGINLMRNYGQHNALLCGIRAARYDVILTMDDDLQNPPEEIQQLLKKLIEGYDVVYGTPHTEQHGFWRDAASQITKLALQSVMGADIARKVSAFRAFRSHLRDAFSEYRSPFLCLDVLLTWGTTRFAAIVVRQDQRKLGKSNYNFIKLFTHALNMMTGFGTLPLRIASLVGFAFTFFGMGVLIYVVGRYFLLGYSVPGFPFLASITAIFAGAQLFSLGIIGEYLARMHFRSMEKPPYAAIGRTSRRTVKDSIVINKAITP